MKESDCFITVLREEGFILSEVKPGAEIGLKDAEQNTLFVREVSGSSLYPILVDLRRIKSISKEARDHFSMRGRKPGVTAIAMLVSSPVSRIIGNFFLGLNRPATPTRMFTSMEHAQEWALRHRENTPAIG